MRQLIGFTFASFLAANVAADNTFVVSNTQDSGAGSLRAAIGQMVANNGLQTLRIEVGQGAQITLNAPLPPMIGQSILVDGAPSPGLRIDGNGWSIFQVITGSSAQTVRLERLALRNGQSAVGGGCVFVNTRGALQVFDATFENCNNFGPAASGAGGGAIRTNGSLRLTRTRFVGNSAGDGGVIGLVVAGGAVSVRGGATVLIEQTQFINNRTQASPQSQTRCLGGSGGALAIDLPLNAGASLTDVQFINNATSCLTSSSRQAGQGGALAVFGAGNTTVSLDRVYFGGNEAFDGGALAAFSVRLNLTNATFFENTAFSSGALYALTSTGAPPTALSLRSSTFARNASSFGSSGASITLIATTVVDVRNTVFAPSLSGPQCAPTFITTSAGAAVFTSDDSCFFALPGSVNGITTLFPGNTFGLNTASQSYGFVPTLNVAAASPLIDNGAASNCPTLDARRISRPRNGGFGTICDVGAVEFSADLLFGNAFEFGQ